jgi:hypothetical protein
MGIFSMSVAPIAVVKKYFNSKMPRGVAMNLFDVTRLTVDMHPDGIGTVLG